MKSALATMALLGAANALSIQAPAGDKCLGDSKTEVQLAAVHSAVRKCSQPQIRSLVQNMDKIIAQNPQNAQAFIDAKAALNAKLSSCQTADDDQMHVSADGEISFGEATLAQANAALAHGISGEDAFVQLYADEVHRGHLENNSFAQVRLERCGCGCGCRGGNCSGGNCNGGNCSGGNCNGGNCSGGNCNGGKCNGGNANNNSDKQEFKDADTVVVIYTNGSYNG